MIAKGTCLLGWKGTGFPCGLAVTVGDVGFPSVLQETDAAGIINLREGWCIASTAWGWSCVRFQTAERNPYTSVTQTQSSAFVLDTKVLLPFPSKAGDTGIRVYVSGSCVLVTQSLPISERVDDDSSSHHSSEHQGMLSFVEGCPFPPWAAHQYLWVVVRVTYASLGQGSRAEGVPSAGRQQGEAEMIPCGPALRHWSL